MEPTVAAAPRKNLTLLIIVAIVSLIVGVLISKFFFAGGLIFNNGKPLALSPNILEITQPVMNFSGQVDSINGDTLTVTQTINTLPIMPPPGTAETETPKPKTITYKVKVSDQTMITRQNVIPAIPVVNASGSANITPPMTQLGIDAIQEGDYVSVMTNEDLRTINSDSFTAVSISLAPAQTSLQGQITEVNGETVTVTGMPTLIPGVVPYPAQYQLKIVDDSTLVRVAGTNRTDISAADLAVNQTVNVSTKQPVRANQVMEIAEIQVMDTMSTMPPINPAPITDTPSVAPPAPDLQPES